MAGKIITKEDLQAAVAAYCKSSGKDSSIGEDGKIRIFQGTPGDNDALLWLEAGSLKTNDPDFALNFAEDWLQGPSKALSPVGNGKMSTPEKYGRKSPVNGSALEAVRECQSTEKATYSPGGGRRVASSKTNIAALMEAGGSLEILSMRHEQDIIEYKVRAVLGNQHVDSSMAIQRMQYLAKKAWDWVPKFAIDDPGLIVSTDDNLLPVFREGAIIKTRISDEGRSLMVSLPAPIALFKELAREWQSAGRVCETKAYNRAADMILRQDFRGREEIAEEQSEVDAIAAKKVGA